MFFGTEWYHFGQEYKDILYINMKIKRCSYLRSYLYLVGTFWAAFLLLPTDRAPHLNPFSNAVRMHLTLALVPSVWSPRWEYGPIIGNNNFFSAAVHMHLILTLIPSILSCTSRSKNSDSEILSPKKRSQLFSSRGMQRTHLFPQRTSGMHLTENEIRVYLCGSLPPLGSRHRKN